MEAVLLLSINLALALALFTGLWVIAQMTRDPSFVDAFWAFGIAILAVSSFVLVGDGEPRALLITVLVVIWGLRLGVHLAVRWRKEGPDARYEALLAHARETRSWPYWRTTALFVFLPQALLLWVTALPAQLGQLSHGPELGALAILGSALALFGLSYEALADAQLARFKADRANTGQVMDKGLWAWSRHPNYFGEALTWWGIWLIAAETGPGLAAILGPAFLTFTLTRWSGAPMLERALKKRRPAYQAYIDSTSAFIPWPPRKPG